MVNNYVPKQGDICYMNFDPIIGLEQSEVRPAIVISKEVFNKYTHMVILCPISSRIKPFSTHFELTSAKKIKGSVLCEHVRSVDYHARKLSYVDKISKEELEEILDIVNGFIEITPIHV